MNKTNNFGYRRLFETAQDGIFILSYPEGRIIDANPFILKLLDCDLAEIIDKKLWELGFIEDKEQALKLFEDLIETGYLRYENLNLKKSNGESIEVEFVCNSYLVGREMVIQCNIRDISDRVSFQVLQKKLFSLKIENLNQIISCLSAIVESRDPYTAGHQFRVADLAGHIARYLKLPEMQIQAVQLTGMLHDIGKFRVPIELLVKPSKLTPEEYNLIKIHPEAGYDILKSLTFEQDIPRFVLEHHERLDGSGYPRGLKADAISLEAKIIAVADLMEAMTSFRPYRPALEFKKALKEIVMNKGKLYDPEVVEACIYLFIEKDYQFPEQQIFDK